MDGRIHVYTKTGAQIGAWGGDGTGKGRFFGLSGVAVGTDGRVYAVDWERVQVFSPEGGFLQEWRLPSYVQGEGIAVGKDGTVSVLNARFGLAFYRPHETVLVVQFGPDGRYRRTFTRPVQGEEFSAEAISLGTAGGVLALVRGAQDRGARIHRFGVRGYLDTWAGAKTRRLEAPRALAAAPSGGVYVLDHSHLLHLSGKGDLLRVLGPFSETSARLDADAMAVAPTGEIYLHYSATDGRNLRLIEKVSPQGRLLAEWKLQ